MLADEDYLPRNRERARKANKEKYWCRNCDCALVGEYGRCPWCGAKGFDNKIRLSTQSSEFNA